MARLQLRAVAGLLLAAAASALLSLADASSPTSAAAEDAAARAFAAFALREGRAYSSEAERALRAATFARNMARAAAHNARNASWTMGATPFADLSAEEFAARVARGGVRRERAARPSRLRPMSPPAPPPASVDWVARGAVSPVGDEGQCGACWAWAAAGAIEGAGFVAAGGGAPLVEASIQELLDCASGNQGCNGGMADLAFQWAVSNKGVASADAYPYTGQGGACRATSVPNSIAVSGFKDVPPNSELALEAAIAQQPVAVVVEADQSVFQLYTGGVMDSACGANVDHAMLAVGYGTDGGKTFYTLKNEWSAAWGEKGYIRIGRGAKFNPAGQCGVQVAPSIVEA